MENTIEQQLAACTDHTEYFAEQLLQMASASIGGWVIAGVFLMSMLNKLDSKEDKK
jgi:hypothetical protein